MKFLLLSALLDCMRLLLGFDKHAITVDLCPHPIRSQACLGQGPFGSCLLIRYRSVTILVDQTLDLLPLLQFVPQSPTYKRPAAAARDSSVWLYPPSSSLSLCLNL